MKREVTELRPTQFALGMREVAKKVEKISAMKEKHIEDFLEEHPVPIVISPHKHLYMIDHHHLVRACWEAGIKKVLTKLQADLSHLTNEEYWKVMLQSHWTYLYDQLGNGPHLPLRLPADIRCLADDPFRSLSWAVRDLGGFEKTTMAFSEFKWAEYFRSKIVIEIGDKGFKKAVDEGMKLCKSREAAHLPGYKK